MSSQSGSPLLALIRRIAASRGPCELSDGELLHRFAVQREESAFAALLERHGPMVLGVCQSILHDVHDAEDVFQATFLVLVRQPQAIGKPASIASWLHGVALRLASRARVEAARRRSHERNAGAMPQTPPPDDVLWRELRPVLHQEIAQLPERYRLPVVLCYLEGKTNKEAAELLGWPQGTVVSNLSRARVRLRVRLTRRGLALTSGLMTAVLAENTARAVVSSPLAARTVTAAVAFAGGSATIGGIGPPVLKYAESLLRSMLLAKIKLAGVILLATATLGAAAAMVIQQVRTPDRREISSVPPPEKPPQMRAAPSVPASSPTRTDMDCLEGAWVVESAEQQGQAIVVLQGRRLVFTGSRFQWNPGQSEVPGILPSAGLEGDFRLEPAAPRRIDLWRRNWRLHGIYNVDDTSLTLCLGEANTADRPAEFTTQPGSKQLRLTLRRE
jgi:RNA polymerase sigma factor (sigma-70 family)